MPGSTSGHRIARRLYPVSANCCQQCTGDRLLQHHHLDGDPANNAPGNVRTLCQDCHTVAHVATGSWGRRAKRA